jgi:hypothetical protein
MPEASISSALIVYNEEVKDRLLSRVAYGNHSSTVCRYPAIMADECEETALQMIMRRYAAFAAWLVRGNRVFEPSRMPEPPRAETRPRIVVPPRQPLPPRPW